MSSEVEELLARHQRRFAVYEEFLRTDNKTLPPPPRSPSPQQREQQRQHQTAPSEAVLSTHSVSGRDAHYVSGTSAGDHNEERVGRSRDRGGHSSPGARAPKTATTSTTSVADVARAIAAHGSPVEPTRSYASIEAGTPPSLQRRSTSRSPCDAHTTAAATSVARHRTSAGELDDIDYLIGERLRSAGRYRLALTPDAAYIKSQAWALRRDQVKEALRREQEDAKLRECTFRPQLGPAAMEGTRDAEAASNGSGGHCPDVGAVKVSVTEDPGVSQHLARLEKARRHRRETETRLNGSNAHHWTSRSTVPHEFQLGLRVAESIPSLRKPYMPITSLGGDLSTATSLQRHEREEIVKRASAAQRRRSFSSAPPSHVRDRRGSRPRSPLPTTTDAARRSVNGEQKKPRRQKGLPRTRQRFFSSTTLIPDAAHGEAYAPEPQRSCLEVGARDMVCYLTDQLTHKDAIIQEQVENLERLHRELDAAMETLHQIASLGASR
ncbi:hypothetical protein conserved [Leishmania donovani]|uniref:Uncharacterized protein n=3 Tax=Leishmania donovani species complex TaxID=38574 RepID=A4HWD6_LEIIN|nr:conserved hypothetical protein [Leishmania infantum JPCM5]TPP53122.1 hypothetical protein CGC20_30090 [Leishmania donovani]CAC9471344.1 hypothetical_protein_-_conserved [Leishmania infantum]CAJ1987464.1 hypothetical protein conserved [Leishmania donovani]CAM66759.1 conserved hypothetical protein [Leishmania infantum JPCM5]SUZ40430.1 hypothetical_protein_-_conserved [Leishmania infantum]|eukprot:XP_001464377.1 conserved hypothetical protein [Leishmania infantum JPCM5]